MLKLTRLSGITLSIQVIISAQTFAANHAFNADKGVLDVDYAHYLPKHDIVYNKPNTVPKSGLTVGNGRVGAMVWNAKGINLQVTGVDASPQTVFSQGWLNLATEPRMDSNYAVFQQTLSLYDGTLTTRYDENRRVIVFGSPNSEVLGIHVEDSRSGVKSASIEVKMWDPATEMTSRGGFNSMQADVQDLNAWKAIAPYTEAASAGISRAQNDATHFGYTLAATVEGAAFATRQVDGRTVRLDIAPASSYTIWIACASRQNAPDFDSPAQARALLAAVKSAGYAATYSAYVDWWHAFWQKSFVQISNPAGDADYMENFYYLAQYMIASGAYGKYPFHFINGVYRYDADKDIHWSGAYWYWNMRNVYYSLLPSNHADAMESLYRLYSGTLAKVKANTQTLHSIDGAWVPETMSWDGGHAHTTESDYTKLIFSTGAEVASSMWSRFEYTDDSTFLKNTAYPYMRETAKFLAAKLSFDAASGKYFMASSNAHETYWNVKNAITDLAAVRALFPKAIEADQALNPDPALRSKWKNVLDNLVAYKMEAYNGGQRYLPHDPPASAQKNVENVTSELIWPYDVTGIGAADYQTAVNSFNSRPNAYSNVWSPDPIQAARLGLADAAYQGMKQMLGKYQNHPNGWTDNDNGVFDFVGVHPIALNECLMQSHNDTIRVFPALGDQTVPTARFTLLAKRGFLVSSEKESGDIHYVGVKSLYGKTAVIANPWNGQAAQVRRASDGAIVANGSGAMLSFPTAAGTVYVVERAAKGLSSFTFAKLSAAPNYSAKTMTWNNITMTLGAGQGKPSAVHGTAARLGLQPWTTLVAGGALSLPAAVAARGYTLTVHAPSGRLVKSVAGTRRHVDLSRDLGLAPGVYLARIRPNAP
jgi:hypothetical protein